MKSPSRRDLERPLGGLGMMTLFTLLWTLIAENELERRDHRIVGVLFAAVVGYFVYNYYHFYAVSRSLPESLSGAPPSTPDSPDKKKLFYLVFALEGLAILIVYNVLVNIQRTDLFISCFALIVGLHFFPLAKIFGRQFDYYIGSWTSLCAIAGLTLILARLIAADRVSAYVAIGCALATASYGFKMVADAKEIIGNLQNIAHEP